VTSPGMASGADVMTPVAWGSSRGAAWNTPANDHAAAGLSAYFASGFKGRSGAQGDVSFGSRMVPSEGRCVALEWIDQPQGHLLCRHGSFVTVPCRRWRAMSPTTPLASSAPTLPQPSFQTYSPIHSQQHMFPDAAPSSPPLSSAPYASRSLPLPSFPIPDLVSAPPSMRAFEAQAAAATAAAHQLSVLAAEDVMNALRFVPSGDVEDAVRQLREQADSQKKEQQLQQQRVHAMSLSDAMQPLHAVSYSDDHTMVSPPFTVLLFPYICQLRPVFRAVVSGACLQMAAAPLQRAVCSRRAGGGRAGRRRAP
jgi:hypothetical protein